MDKPVEINLNDAQWKALKELSRDPGRWIFASTLSKLRKLGLVGKVVKRNKSGQKTTSPLTDLGRVVLAKRLEGES